MRVFSRLKDRDIRCTPDEGVCARASADRSGLERFGEEEAGAGGASRVGSGELFSRLTGEGVLVGRSKSVGRNVLWCLRVLSTGSRGTPTL